MNLPISLLVASLGTIALTAMLNCIVWEMYNHGKSNLPGYKFVSSLLFTFFVLGVLVFLVSFSWILCCIIFNL